jgi:hypothetical protein
MTWSALACVATLSACYLPTDPELEETGATRADTAGAGLPTDTDEPPDDTYAVAGDTWCWTVAPIDKQLALLQVDMNAHTWTEVGRYGSVTSSFHTQSLARLGDHLYMSAYGGNNFEWVDLDLSAGTLSVSGPAEPVSVLTDGMHLYWGLFEGICEYESWGDLVTDHDIGCVSGFDHATRFTRFDALVYGAWHSTSEVQVYDASSGFELETIRLDDWGTWVWGMSIAGGMLHLIDDARNHSYTGSGVRIARFDPATGDLIDHTFIDGPRASGLWCEAGAPP